jgi:hypothetical protein
VYAGWASPCRAQALGDPCGSDVCLLDVKDQRLQAGIRGDLQMKIVDERAELGGDTMSSVGCRKQSIEGLGSGVALDVWRHCDPGVFASSQTEKLGGENEGSANAPTGTPTSSAAEAIV